MQPSVLPLGDDLRNVLDKQVLERALLVGTLKNSLRNHGERPRAIVEHVRVGIYQRARIHAPLQMRVDVRSVEVDAFI